MQNQIAQTTTIPIDRLRPSRWQPRQRFDPLTLLELARSIQANGLINPPLAFAINPDGAPYSVCATRPAYELIAGERRVRALIALRWTQLQPDLDLAEACTVLADHGFNPLPGDSARLLGNNGYNLPIRLEPDADLARLHRLAVLENLDRENLTPLEEARAIHDLIQANTWTQRQAADQLNRSQPWISKRLALLDLAPTVRDSLTDARITATHAETLTRLPPALQPAIAAHIAAQPDQLSTRDLDKLTASLAAFVDPDRWQPNPEKAYSPHDRNLLHLVAHCLQAADLAGRSDQILALQDIGGWGPLSGNILPKKPGLIVTNDDVTGKVLNAIGQRGNVTSIWKHHALALSRTCDACIFNPYPLPDDVDVSNTHVHCERWKQPADRQPITCTGCITFDDPVVIPYDYTLESSLRQLGLHKPDQPRLAGAGAYLTSLADYLAALPQIAGLKTAETQANQQSLETGYLVQLNAYLAWQADPPARVDLDHPQAHRCDRCAQATNTIGDAIHCPYLDTSLSRYGRPAGPRQAVLVTRAGALIPRCAAYTDRRFPDWPREITPSPGVILPDRDQALAWLRAILPEDNDGGYDRDGLWGVLSWLPYGRKDEKNSYPKLLSWLRDTWDALGGDPTIATLLDLAISETAARLRYGHKSIIQLFNPLTRQPEDYAPCDFDVAAGLREWPNWQKWPDDFPKPWDPDPVIAAAAPTPTEDS